MRALRQQISELQIDKALKHQLLEVINEKKRYGLVWEDSSEEAYDRMQEELPVFMEDAAKRLDSAPVGSPNHVLIEGDNLNALAALSYTHAGKIDVIYIDPPYNTGNKDFVYNDSFVDKEDGYRHSKWLSFMDRRLRIAKKLLSEKGVIFISIDDNEQAQLKMLCDEIFEEDNFVGDIIWEKTDSPRMDVKGFSVRHDYILVYKRIEFELKRITVTEIPKHYNRTDEKGRRYYTKPLRLMGGHLSESLFYGIISPDGTEVFPFEKSGEKGGWRWSKAKYEAETERIEWTNGKNGWTPYFRIYAENMRDMPVQTVWPFSEVGSTRTAKTELTKIIDNGLFNYPKPSSLIKYIEKISSDKDSTILDFFAGSGTTLHATMQLNAEDGGHRKCILVTNNENNICESVTYERNKRVIQGYTTPKGEQVAGLADNNLRYYRTAFVPREHSNRNRRNLMSSLVDVLCIKNDIYKEEETFGGERFKPSVLRYFNDEAGQMLIVLDERVVSTIVPMIADVATKDNPLKVYVYSDGAYAYEDEFREVLPVIDLCAMPDAYLQALQSSDALPEQRYSEETIAEFNASNATATQDKEAVAAALSDTYDYVNE